MRLGHTMTAHRCRGVADHQADHKRGCERLHKPLNTHHRALGASSFLCALHERRCQLLEVVRGVSNSSSHLMSIRDLYLSSEP